MVKDKRYFTPKQKTYLWYRQNGRCGMCGRSLEDVTKHDTHAHHVFKWDDGGATTVMNGVMLCRECHDQAHNHSQFKQSIVIPRSEFPHANWDKDGELEYRHLLEDITDRVKRSDQVMRNIDNYWQERKNILKDAQQKLRSLKLDVDDRQSLYGMINNRFETINSEQSKEKQQYEDECRRNFDQLNRKASECVSMSQRETDWKSTREHFKSVQQSFKGVKLKKDQRDQLYEQMTRAFDTLSNRQTKDREDYERECQRNFDQLDRKVSECVSMSHRETDWKHTREHFKSVQQTFKGVKLKKDQRDKLYEQMTRAFDTLSNRQTKDREDYERECQRNFDQLDRKASECVSMSHRETDWKTTRERFKSVQQSFKGVKLKKDQRDQLYEQMTRAFDTLSQRQTKDREDYERECQRNFDQLNRDVNACMVDARRSTDWKKTREHFKKVQQSFKDKKLKKEQRDKLYKGMQQAFDTLSDRQTKDREKYDRDCEYNFTSLNREVNKCLSEAKSTTDWKATRDRFKKVQQSFKDKTLKKDQRDKLYTGMNQAFETLSNRQTKDREDYNRECDKNYNSLRSKVNDCVSRSKNSTDWKATRDYFKQVQQSFKGLKMKKEQRDELYGNMQQAFDTLSNRQTREREQYERECQSNHSRVKYKVHDAMNKAAGPGDLYEILNFIKAVKSEVFDTRPMKKEDKGNLIDKIKGAEQKVRYRIDEEKRRKKDDFKRRTAEKIQKLQGVYDNLASSIVRDESYLSDQHSKLYNVRPGPREGEIRSSIQNRIRDIEQRISSKKHKKTDIYNSIQDLRRKL